MSQARLLSPGTILRPRVLQDVSGRSVALPPAPAPGPPPGLGMPALVHLQFRRFAGCPICHLHLRSFARRHRELETAGVREVVVFHSPADELRPHTADLPFAVVADPDKRLYAAFGVGASPRALLDPRAWLPILRVIGFATVGIVTGTVRPPAANPQGGRLGLPADFLIAPQGSSEGRVAACKYGAHADDQWTVDEVLAHARTWREESSRALIGA